MGLVLALVGGLLHFVASPQVLIAYLKYAVIAVFLLNVFYAVRLQGLPLYHPYLIFLGMIGLFILSRIFVDVIGGDSFAQTTQFSHYVFDKSVQIRLLVNVIIALLGLQLGAILVSFFAPWEFKHPDEDIDWKKIGLIIFYIGLPFLAYQYLMAGLEVLEKGYAAKLNGDLEYKNSFIVTVMSRLAFGGFFFYLAGIPKSKYFYLHITIFLMVFYIQLLGGSRNHPMCFSLILFSVIFVVRQYTIKWYHISLFISLLFVVSAFVGVYRSPEKQIPKEWAQEFVNQQGFAMQILGHSIEHKEDIDYRFRDMFAHTRHRKDLMKSRFTHEPVVVDKVSRMEKYNTLSYQLTYHVNKKALKGGWDMASSYLAEFFLLGREWLMFLGNILVGFVTVLLFNVAVRKKLGIVLLLYIFPSWIFISRDNIFDFITDNISNILFMFLILLFVNMYKRVEYRLPSLFRLNK